MSLFVIAGGGTGGHVMPALAVAGELRRSGHEVLFIGTRTGMEARLVPAQGYPMAMIEIGALNRAGWKQQLRTLLQLPASVMAAGRLFSERRPGAVLSLGGYVSGPAMLAAVWKKVPLVVMEPNAVPGFANRKMANRVSRALVNFAGTAAYFPAGRTEVIGMPVREAFFSIRPRRPMVDGPFTVLITGGSQGSRSLNRAALESWPLLGRSSRALAMRFLHQTGPHEHVELSAAFQNSGLKGEVTPFIDDMPEAFAKADLVICRSGASTVSELAAAGRASILVPFPFAADDHQLRNAETMQQAGAARLLLDRELSGQRMYEMVMDAAANPAELGRMGEAARKMARPGAARRAAAVLEEVQVR